MTVSVSWDLRGVKDDQIIMLLSQKRFDQTSRNDWLLLEGINRCLPMASWGFNVWTEAEKRANGGRYLLICASGWWNWEKCWMNFDWIVLNSFVVCRWRLKHKRHQQRRWICSFTSCSGNTSVATNQYFCSICEGEILVLTDRNETNQHSDVKRLVLLWVQAELQIVTNVVEKGQRK